MIRKFFLAIYLILTSFGFAQEIYFCESYTEDGEPIGAVNKLPIKPYGTAIYILFDNENKSISDNVLYVFIDKLLDGSFRPYESKTINVEKNKAWAVTNFEFKETGNYQIYVMNNSQKKLAGGKLEVFFTEKTEDPSKKISNVQISGKYGLIFCEMVIKGKPLNIINDLSISRNLGQVTIYIDHHSPFNFEKFSIKVWKQNNINFQFDDLVDSKKYKLLPIWSDVYFKYKFNSTGNYKIDVFSESGSLFASNIISVVN